MNPPKFRGVRQKQTTDTPVIVVVVVTVVGRAATGMEAIGRHRPYKRWRDVSEVNH